MVVRDVDVRRGVVQQGDYIVVSEHAGVVQGRVAVVVLLLDLHKVQPFVIASSDNLSRESVVIGNNRGVHGPQEVLVTQSDSLSGDRCGGEYRSTYLADPRLLLDVVSGSNL